MGSFSQLIFDFFVDIELLLQGRNLLLQFLISKDEFFGLFGLILELGGKLMILEHGQSSGGLELFSFERDKISFHILDFMIHFILDFVSGLYFFSFLVGNFSQLIGLFDFDSFPEFLSFLFKLVSFTHVKFIFGKLALILGDFEMIVLFGLFKVFHSGLLLVDLVKEEIT